MPLDADVFRRLWRARDLLRESVEPRHLREIARESGMSMFHFIRQFEALFGSTPHQFRIAARLDRARILLAARQHSVTLASRLRTPNDAPAS